MSDDEIRDYIRANMRRHTREAIRQRLVEDGHDPERVDAIWAEAWQASIEPGGAAPGRGLSTFALVLLILGALPGAWGALTIVSLGSGRSDLSMAAFLGLYALLYVGLGVAAWFGVRRLEDGGLSGAAAVLIGVLLPVAYGVLMFGGCAAAFNLTAGV